MIYPYETDDKTFINLEFLNQKGTFQFERQKYMITIQGSNEFDLFEELPYAG